MIERIDRNIRKWLFSSMKPNMATNMFHGLRVIDYIMTYTWEEVPRGVKEINERE